MGVDLIPFAYLWGSGNILKDKKKSIFYKGMSVWDWATKEWYSWEFAKTMIEVDIYHIGQIILANKYWSNPSAVGPK